MYREDLYQCMCRMIMSNLPFRIVVSTLSHCSTSLPPFQGHPWGVSIPMDRYQGDHRELLDKIVTVSQWVWGARVEVLWHYTSGKTARNVKKSLCPHNDVDNTFRTERGFKIATVDTPLNW